ncbi:hypothetical protein D9M70_539480 [compost metagenome]
MQEHDNRGGAPQRFGLVKHAVAEAACENKRHGPSEAEPQPQQEIDAELAALEFSSWKSVPLA